MPTVLVAGKIHPRGIELLRNAPDIEIDYVEEVSLASYQPFIERADAVLIRTQPLPADVIQRASRLKIVSRHGVGYDSVDVAELNRRGIPLALVGDVNSRPVAEHTMLLLLAAAKRLLRYDSSVRTGRWDYRNALEATELDGKRLLIIGFGRVGRLVAQLASAFGVSCMTYDPFQSEEAIRATGVESVTDLAKALAEADFVTVHAPKVSGDALLGPKEIAAMKPGAIIVNTARGGIVDEAALAEALDRGAIAGAGLDVFEAEPPPLDHKLLGNQRVIVTPHSASLTEECAARMAVSAASNILDFFAGRLDRSLVINEKEIQVLHHVE
jgi:D-3-phosphoglycerate dehydrogenase